MGVLSWTITYLTGCEHLNKSYIDNSQFLMNPLACVLGTLRFTGHYRFCHEQSLSLYEHSPNLYNRFIVNNHIHLLYY